MFESMKILSITKNAEKIKNNSKIVLLSQTMVVTAGGVNLVQTDIHYY